MGKLMTVLVTGGAGYIGKSHGSGAGGSRRKSVVVIDNLSTGFAAFLPEGVRCSSAMPRMRTWSRASSQRMAWKASFTSRAPWWCRIRCAIRSPITATHHDDAQPAERSGEVPRQPLHLFIDRGGVWQSGSRCRFAESAPTRPMSPYGSSKLMTEIMLHDVASAHGMSYVVLRYFNVAAPIRSRASGLPLSARRIL